MTLNALLSDDSEPATPTPVYSAHVCRSNAELIAETVRLYAPPGSKIADVTYGKGVFWKRTNLALYDFHPSDLITVRERAYDLRKLPYAQGVFDVVVLDPPYVNHGSRLFDANYRNGETTRHLDHCGIIALYRDGLREAHRVVRAGGTVWVKCQDEIESNIQRWSHIEILREALNIGLYGKDLFAYVQANNPSLRHPTQMHARRNHSYLWIFRKPLERELPTLKRCGVFDLFTPSREVVTSTPAATG